jgi:hypothetical protein
MPLYHIKRTSTDSGGWSESDAGECPCDGAKLAKYESGWMEWQIELTPEQVIELPKKYGEIIIGEPPSYSNSGLPWIEIYDDYRE